MKNELVKIIAGLSVALFFLTGCSKNETRFFADKADTGLSIFSNTNNNIFTCYVNDKPWRTINRVSGGFLSLGETELNISKKPDTLQDMLIIQWLGYFEDDINNEGTISVYIPIPPGFTNSDISTFQGTRITIDSTKAYFIASIGGQFNNIERGSGTIYFNRASFDLTGTGTYSGNLSGLLEADFPSFKITRGRFDHQLSPLQIRF